MKISKLNYPKLIPKLPAPCPLNAPIQCSQLLPPSSSYPSFSRVLRWPGLSIWHLPNPGLEPSEAFGLTHSLAAKHPHRLTRSHHLLTASYRSLGRGATPAIWHTGFRECGQHQTEKPLPQTHVRVSDHRSLTGAICGSLG